MKTAKEFVEAGFKDWTIAGQIKRECEKIINEARKEAIKEVAEKACIDWGKNDFQSGLDSTEISVDKDSILSLIDELM